MAKKILTRMPYKRGLPQRWRKIYRGKIYYFRGDYETALAEWQTISNEASREAGEIVAWAKARLEQEEVIEQAQQDLQAIIRGDKPVKVATRVKTIGQAVCDFLAIREAKVKAGKMSAGRYDTLKRCLNHFAEFSNNAMGVDKLNGATLTAYHTTLLEKVGNGWSSSYTQTYGIACKTFIRWAWENELIDNLPRNISSRELSIAVNPQKVRTFSVAEIKMLLDNATERLKLYLLLMVNTGSLQKDIADLQAEEVDWMEGAITRRRSKTGNWENVPVVRYLLWTDTFRLLQKYGKRQGRVLLNDEGRPLKQEFLRDGKLTKVDNIACSYHRLCDKLKIKKPKPLKLLRKTSPTLLEASPYPQTARHFLGHSPRSVADKHYIAPDQNTFNKAVAWLGEQYGVETLAKKTPK